MKIKEIRKIATDNVSTVSGCGTTPGSATDKPPC